MTREIPIAMGWIVAAVASAGAHAAVAIWLTSAAPPRPAPPQEAGFLSVELASLPEAPAAPPQDLPPAPASIFQEARPGDAAPAEDVETPPEEPAAPDGETQAPETAPERPAPEIVEAPVTTGAIAPSPPRRPRDLAPAPTRVARERPRRAAAIDSAASGTQAREAPRAAAAQTGRGGTTPNLTPRWRSQLAAHLERHRRYPASARESGVEGVVHLSFTIDASGRVLAHSVARSSGSAALDAAAVDMIRRASPLPPPPDATASVSVTAPVNFRLR
ncbi:MAG: energy transducer TonB [Microvirga sp.]|nr:energy transducer TonB [Microvirga sp.]